MDAAEFGCGEPAEMLGSWVFVAAAWPGGGIRGAGLSALTQDEMPKGTLSFSPPSCGFHGSEKTQDPVGQAACET